MTTPGISQTRIHTLPIGAPLARPPHPVRVFAVWAALAAVAGALIGVALQAILSVLTDKPFDLWLIRQSVLFAEAVALSALVAARFALPFFAHLRPLPRYVLVLMTLAGGAVAITGLSVALRPGIVFARPLTFLALAGANTALAVVVGGALIAWENIKSRLARAYEQLRVKEAFEREMQLARDVQQGLLPVRPPVLPGYEVAFACRTAALVGGDTLDFVPLPDGGIGLAVGDVSGKGIAAALLMANVQALVRVVAALEDDPARLNAILSEAVLSRSVAGRYVTFAYVMLEPASGRMRYSVAGHHPPVIVGQNGTRLLEQGGIPLGLLHGMPYAGGSDVLGAGEAIVMYTDGLVEATSITDPDREFGRHRLYALCQEHHRRGARALTDALLSALDEHVGDAPASDDTTLLVVRRLPLAGAA